MNRFKFSRPNIKEIFKKRNKGKVDEFFKRCNHHTAAKFYKKECKVDEYVGKYGYCREHICEICLGNTQSSGNQAKKPILIDGKVPEIEGKQMKMYHCNGHNQGKMNRLGEKIDYHCGEIYLEGLKGEVESKLTNNQTNILCRLSENDIEAGFKSEIEEFLEKLVEKESSLLTNSLSETEPFFTKKGLKEIRDFIKESSKLKEKEELILVYSDKATVQSIIEWKIITLAEIGRNRKRKKDLENLSKKRSNLYNQMRSLDGWDLLSSKSKNTFLDEITNFLEDKLDGIIERVKTEIKRVKDDRERERDKNGNPNNNLPPQKEPKDAPNSPTPQSPSPSDKSPKDNSLAELNEAKNKVKTDHNLSEEEFNLVITPLTDKNLLEYVSLLIGKVKESKVEGKSLDKVYSLLEFLLSYRDAETGSLKQKAYEAVNSYQLQVDLAIQGLENQKNLTDDCLKKLVASQNQEELNIIYNEIKNFLEFQQPDNKKIVDNHQKRVQEAINLESDSVTTELEKKIAKKLRVVINSDTDKSLLENFRKEIEEFQGSSEPEKKSIYNKHREIIEATLTEIVSELNRREKSTQEQNKTPVLVDNKPKNPVKPNKNSTNPAVIIIGGILLLTSITFLAYQIFRKKRVKKRLKLKKV